MSSRPNPSLPIVRTDNQALNLFIEGVRESLERMAGVRGDALNRVVTLRDLQNMGFDVSGAVSARGAQPAKAAVFPGGAAGVATGLRAISDPEAFAREIYNTRLFQELIAGFDDPARFEWVPRQLRQELLNSIAEEAGKRGTDIRKVEQIVRTATEAFASKLEELTASFAQTSAGVRSLSFAYADADRAIATDVTQVQAQLNGTDVSANALGVGGTTAGAAYATLAALIAAVPTGVTAATRKYYKVANPVPGQPNLLYTWDTDVSPAQYKLAGKGTTTGAFFAGVEQTLKASADRATGADAQYTVKVTAGGAMAGFGLGAYDNGSGSVSSAFLIQADRFAIVQSSYSGGLTTSPSTANVPFGVDASGAYINGTLRINTGGTTLATTLSTANTALSDAATAQSTAVAAAFTAAWASVTSRPGELTDGRIATAINSAGLVISGAKPGINVTTGSAGLYMGADFMGYYNGASWKTYMDNSGNFYLGGTAGALQWNGSTLTVTGAITAGGTITGATVQTASSGARIVMAGTTVKAMDAGGNAIWEMDDSGKASFNGGTYDPAGGANYGAAVARLGTVTNPNAIVGFLGYNNKASGGQGVMGISTSGNAFGVGVYGVASHANSVGVLAVHNSTGVALQVSGKIQWNGFTYSAPGNTGKQFLCDDANWKQPVTLKGYTNTNDIAFNWDGTNIKCKVDVTEFTIYPSAASGVSSFNTRSGAVSLTSGDVTGALGFTPQVAGSYASGSGSASGTNTGDNATNALYSGLVSNATHSGDATGSGALTLATVNSNVGSWGGALSVPTITVNAKGLVTAASINSTLTPALIGALASGGTAVNSTQIAGHPIADVLWSTSYTAGSPGTPNYYLSVNVAGLVVKIPVVYP